MTNSPEWAKLGWWDATTAGDLVRMIDGILPLDWTRICDGPGVWRWESPTADADRTEFGVAVNAADDPVLVPYTGWPDPVGPTVLAYNRGGDPFAAVTLPSLSDRQDRRAAMRILAAVVPALSAPKTAD